MQRVSRASVMIDGARKSAVGRGLLVLVGIEKADGADDVDWLIRKILSLRIFDDDAGKMNRSVVEIGGEIMVVSQFTLHARVKKGARPSFERSARPSVAVPLYEQFVSSLETALGKPIATGEFGAVMKVELENDGPVTIWIDSRNRE